MKIINNLFPKRAVVTVVKGNIDFNMLNLGQKSIKIGHYYFCDAKFTMELSDFILIDLERYNPTLCI